MHKVIEGARPVQGRAAATIAVVFGLLALAIRLYFVMHVQVLQAVDSESVRGDAAQYYHYALNIVQRGVFSSAMPSSLVAPPDSFRDPAYPIFLAVAIKLTSAFEGFYSLVLITQATLGGITVSLLVLAGRNWLPVWALTTAAFLMAIWPHSVAITVYILSETLAAFFCAAALLATDYALRKNAIIKSVFAGVLWSLAGLTNATILPVATLLGGLVIVQHRVHRRTALALILSSLIIPLAWGVRSTTLPSNISSTSRAITNFVQGSWPSYHHDFQLALRKDEVATRNIVSMQNEMDALQADPITGLNLIRFRMRQDPVAYITWYLSKPFLLWSWDIRVGQGDVYVYPTRNSPFFRSGSLWLLEAGCYIANPLIFWLMIAGIINAVLTRAPFISTIAAALAVFVTLAYSTLQSEPRYSIPFRGVEILLAMNGLNYATDILTNVRKRLSTR